MTLRVATVLSAREWEARLVAAARTTAAVRLVVRAFRPDEILERVSDIDVVVVGSEVPWATVARIAAWSRSGLRVVGVHPAGDRPAGERLAAGGADVVIPDDVPTETMLREIRLLEPASSRAAAECPLIAVTGARGAPGRTEVALALAWLMSGQGTAVLADVDLEAPGVAIRMGIPPRPDLADAVDEVHGSGSISATSLHAVGRLRVLPGSHRPGEPSLRIEPVQDVIDAIRSQAGVVVDCGPWPQGSELIKAATTALVVVDSSPRGIVRAAGMLAEWAGPPPCLVLNRVPRTGRDDAVLATRRWTGLEPEALIPDTPRVAAAARAGAPPARQILRQLHPVAGR